MASVPRRSPADRLTTCHDDLENAGKAIRQQPLEVNNMILVEGDRGRSDKACVGDLAVREAEAAGLVGLVV